MTLATFRLPLFLVSLWLPVCLAAQDNAILPSGSTILPAEAGISRSSTERFEWNSAIAQSFKLLAFEHAFRFAVQPGTRQRLGGPFFKDYWSSVKALKGWGDGDHWFVNYVNHPIQGSATSYVQIQNDPHGRKLRWGDEGYWKSRAKAFAWNTAYSIQWELGPISESSLGNVGQRKGTQGYVDIVMTPLGGLAMNLAEDATDRWLERWESGRSRRKVRLARTFLNPGRSVANLLRAKRPWFRDTRP